jgi:DNA-binding transcriptional LysR family regulator
MNNLAVSARISMRHLRGFVAVAQHRSLTKASEMLSVTQSALSITIQHLEEDLGVKLFDRTTRRLDLTQAGEEFLPNAQKLLGDFDATLRNMRALGLFDRGRVGVAAVPSVMALLLPDVVAKFIDVFPGVDIYLREDNSGGVQQRILNGDVDFGISSLWHPDPELVFEPIFHDRFGVVFAPDHPFSITKSDITWNDLHGMRVLGFSADLGMQHQLASMPNIPDEIRSPRYQVSNTSTIETLVMCGLGVSVMSALAAQRPPLDRLKLRLLHGPEISRCVGILYRKGKSLSPSAAEFVDWVRASIPRLARFEGISLVRQGDKV